MATTYTDKINGTEIAILTIETERGPRQVVASEHVRILERDLRHTRPTIPGPDFYVDYLDWLVRGVLKERFVRA